MAAANFIASLRVQLRVIKALFFRELITRFGRHNIGFFWMFVEPMMFTIGITTLWTVSGMHHTSDLPIAAFALTGYSTVLLWRNMPSRTIKAVHPNLSLMYHRNVRVLDIYLSRVAIEIMGATMSFVLLSALFIGVEWILPPEDVLKVVAGWLMTIWFGVALAIFIGSLSEEFELIDKFFHPVTYVMFPLSGAGFMVESAPAGLRDFVLYLPMIHGVELIRDGYFGSQVHAIYDMRYMTLINTTLTFLAFFELRRVARKIIPE